MSFFDALKKKLEQARASHPEPDSLNATAVHPEYCTPTAYEVRLDKNVLLVHRGLNRRQRRELDYKLSHFNNPRPRPTSFHPNAQFKSKESIKKALRETPSNFPVRKLFGKYLFEPEYWQVQAAMKEREEAFRNSLSLQEVQEPAINVVTDAPQSVPVPSTTMEALPQNV